MNFKFFVCLFWRNENKLLIFSDLYSMGGFQIPLFRTEDKGKKLAELDVLSPYPVLIGLQLGDLTVHLQLGWGCRKKIENNGSDNCKSKAKPRPSVWYTSQDQCSGLLVASLPKMNWNNFWRGIFITFGLYRVEYVLKSGKRFKLTFWKNHC